MHGDDIVHGMTSRVGIFYGGDANTLHVNKGFDIKTAENIYNNFMKKFSGVKAYQDYCRKAVMANGYILMNPVLKHRAHIFDAEWQKLMQAKFKEDGFWQYYNEMKRTSPSCDTVQNVKKYFKRKADSERQSINYRMNGSCVLVKFLKFGEPCDGNTEPSIVVML